MSDRPKGARHLITEGWLERVDSEIERRRAAQPADTDEPKWTRRRLAMEVGCDEATLSNIFAGRQKSSALVPRISAVLEISSTTYTVDSERQARWFEMIKRIETAQGAEWLDEHIEDFEQIADSLESRAAAELKIEERNRSTPAPLQIVKDPE